MMIMPCAVRSRSGTHASPRSFISVPSDRRRLRASGSDGELKDSHPSVPAEAASRYGIRPSTTLPRKSNPAPPASHASRAALPGRPAGTAPTASARPFLSRT